MKKCSLLLALLMITTPAFASQLKLPVYTVSSINPVNKVYSLTPKVTSTKYTTVYSNDGTTKYIISPKVKSLNTSSRRAQAETLGAILAGAGLATGRLSLLANPTITSPQSAVRAFLDPYIINIDDKNYVLVKDSKDNNWTVENILGYNDSKQDLFESLKKLESDGDSSKITNKELNNAGIRFVLLNADQSLALNERDKDFDLSKVQYIDMKNLRTALGNKNQDGTFGYFYVIVKEDGKKRAYPGRVTFEDEKELNKYIQ